MRWGEREKNSSPYTSRYRRTTTGKGARRERIFRRPLSIITGPACLLRRHRCLGVRGPFARTSTVQMFNNVYKTTLNVDEPRALHCCTRNNIFYSVSSRRRMVQDTTTLYPVTSLSLSPCIMPTSFYSYTRYSDIILLYAITTDDHGGDDGRHRTSN